MNDLNNENPNNEAAPAAAAPAKKICFAGYNLIETYAFLRGYLSKHTDLQNVKFEGSGRLGRRGSADLKPFDDSAKLIIKPHSSYVSIWLAQSSFGQHTILHAYGDLSNAEIVTKLVNVFTNEFSVPFTAPVDLSVITTAYGANPFVDVVKSVDDEIHDEDLE